MKKISKCVLSHHWQQVGVSVCLRLSVLSHQLNHCVHAGLEAGLKSATQTDLGSVLRSSAAGKHWGKFNTTNEQ